MPRVNEMKMRSVVITMDVPGTYVIDLFEGAVRIGMSSTTEYQRIGGIVAHWLTQRNITILIGTETEEEDDEV